ncbi:MAG: ABC transporter permease [Capsulimonadales bacterium]|nr:ABC transporter permease [Capsulimonadales bacterium]
MNTLIAEAQEVWRYRELLQNLVQRELDVRYKGSRFGIAWSLANPIIRAIVLWAVFDLILNYGVKDYSAYLLTAFFPWTFFLTGVLDAADSVSKQMELVKKVYFPRELLPLATTLANLRHFLLSLCVLGLYLVFLYGRDSFLTHRLSLPPAEIFLLPILIVMQTLLIGGIAFYLSALNVFFEDTKFIAAVLLDLLLYAVPIVYFVEQVAVMRTLPPAVTAFVHQLYFLNPISVILICYRRFLLHPQEMGEGRFGLSEPVTINQGVPWPYFLLSILLCFAIFFGGYRFFNRRKWRFVEQQ